MHMTKHMRLLPANDSSPHFCDSPTDIIHRPSPEQRFRCCLRLRRPSLSSVRDLNPIRADYFWRTAPLPSSGVLRRLCFVVPILLRQQRVCQQVFSLSVFPPKHRVRQRAFTLNIPKIFIFHFSPCAALFSLSEACGRYLIF